MKPTRGPLVGPMVISEIDYRPSNSDEYIELTNISDQPVKLYDPLDPAITWRVDGIFYELPTGIEIPAGGSLLIVAERPSDVCLARHDSGDTDDKQPQIIGPYPVHLADGGQTITLLKPTPSANEGSDRAFIEIDRIDYDDGWPWPVAAAGKSVKLRRVDLAGFGNEPTNWQEVSALATVAAADAGTPHVELCTFEAFREETDSADVEIHWVSYTEDNVVAYRLWRSETGARTDADLLNDTSIPAQGTDGTSAHYRFVDSAGQEPDLTTYWLEDGQRIRRRQRGRLHSYATPCPPIVSSNDQTLNQ